MPGWFTRVRIRSEAAYSLSELLVVITVIGILAAVGIPMISGLVGSSKHATAEKNLKDLNEAVLKFGQSNWELVLASSSGTSDEIAIFESLQYRNLNEDFAAPGSPYLSPMMNAPTSSSADTYRAFWNGRMYQLLSPGQPGEGIDLMQIKAVSGHTPSFSADPNYKPVGAP